MNSAIHASCQVIERSRNVLNPVQARSIDPVTFEVLNHRLMTISEEMGIQYMRCSGSNVLITGNDAAAAAHRITDSVPVICVRHPSYGGQTQFQGQIAELYGHSARVGSLF